MNDIVKQENKYDMNNDDMLETVKQTVCKDITNNEFKLFIHTCKRLGLDPMARQIYPVKRYDSHTKKEVMTIQTGIDGYRLIADRTGKYAPGKAPKFFYDDQSKLVAATAYVKKQTQDGTWHEVEATALYSEYVATTKGGYPTHFWKTKAHIMLSKCAEALALRKAFPSELSGIYTKEEMDQAENPVILEENLQEQVEATEEQIAEFVKKHSQTFDANKIYTFAERRSNYFNHTMNETFTKLIQNEDSFIKEMNNWLIKHDHA